MCPKDELNPSWVSVPGLGPDGMTICDDGGGGDGAGVVAVSIWVFRWLWLM